MSSDKNLHAGHRSRMKEQYLEFGAKSFSDHELLEMLLYYSIPRSDTNAIAHKLIEVFGSLEKALDADVKLLQTVDGIGEHSAILLSLASDISARKLRNRNSNKKKFSTISEVGEFLHSHYRGARQEYFSALYFDRSMNLIGTTILTDASETEVSLTPTRIAKEAILRGAASVVIAHNHLDNEHTFSSADRKITNLIQSTLSAVGIPLLEHIVVNDAGYFPSMHLCPGAANNLSITKNVFGDNFATPFYEIKE